MMSIESNGGYNHSESNSPSNGQQDETKLHFNKGPVDVRKHIIAIRHGENEPALENERNQPLTPEGQEQAKELGRDIADFYSKHSEDYPGGVLMIRSSKTRTRQTSAICQEVLESHQIAIEVRESEDVREIEQGDMIIQGHQNPEDIYPPLHSAWLAFQQELRQGNIHYYFGDAVEQESGLYKYKELIEYFNIFGESEADFTIRLYKFLIDNFKLSTDQLLVIVTHQGIVSRIQRICDLATRVMQDPDRYRDSNFIAEEYHADRIPVGHGAGVILFGYDYKGIAGVLTKEYEKLLAEIEAINQEFHS
jgi:broad specificity phosphatase PhoE